MLGDARRASQRTSLFLLSTPFPGSGIAPGVSSGFRPSLWLLFVRIHCAHLATRVFNKALEFFVLLGLLEHFDEASVVTLELVNLK